MSFDISSTLLAISPEALVAWDRDVPTSFVPYSFGYDSFKTPTMYESITSPKIFWFEFVCDPVPHWRSHEDAIVLSGPGYPVSHHRLHRERP